jgi:3'-phosphoadenosine 5'-phosphosulfate sulfotransferase (PAPS reductase)/FAD synthetase
MMERCRMNVLAFSGGKDSTALALRLAELGEEFILFFTPTGDELPDCIDHIARVTALTGRPLVARSCGRSLRGLIEAKACLPNQNMRWCTRMLKIEPCKAFLLEHPGSVLLVGLRADEEHREGMWGDSASYCYPLREWGWDEARVWSYLAARGVEVPDRTDCALCYDQRLSEWYRLWKDYPQKYALGEQLEAATGHTFRSPSRDTWPAALKDLRAEFEQGRVPRGIVPLPLFGTYDTTPRHRCRVCTL